MANGGTAFPAYIRAEYDRGRGFTDLEADAKRAATGLSNTFRSAGQDIAQQFQRDFDQINRTVRDALAAPRTAAGGIDLGGSRLRAQAQDAQQQAAALRDVANAAARAADQSGDLSQATRLYVQAARAAATEAEQQARALGAQAASYERLQVEIDRTAQSSGRLVVANDRATAAGRQLAAGANAQQQAMIGVGQQLQDVTVSLASGQQASVVFAQQLPQLAYAMTSMGGAAGRVGAFFAGPWGVALSIGSVALGALVAGLAGTKEALEDVKFASDAVGEAQSILGGVLDLTTGRIDNQSVALMTLARAKLAVARIDAQTRQAEARQGIADIQNRDFEYGGGLGGGFAVRRRPRDARDVISQQVLSGELDPIAAIERLENLQRIGRLTRDEFAAAASAIANFNVETRNLEVFAATGRLLDGRGTASDRGTLLRPGRAARDTSARDAARAAAELQRLNESGEDAAKTIAGIVGNFDRTPPAIARANRELARLRDLASDLQRKPPPGYEGLVAQIAAAQETVRNGLAAEFDERLRLGDQELQLQALRLAGYDDQAEALQLQFQIMRELGVASSDQLETALEANRIGAERYRQLQAQRAEQAALVREAERLDRLGTSPRAQIEQARGVRGSIDQALTRLPDDARGALAGLASDIRRQFNEYLARSLSERIFGGAFRDLEAELNPRVQADRRVAAASDPVISQFGAVAESARQAAAELRSLASQATGQPGAIDPVTGDIVVTADKRASGPIGAVPTNIFARSITAALEPLLGKESPLARGIGTLAEQGLQGAFYGQSAAGLIFGSKGSQTGAGIGGALGNALGTKLGQEFGQQLGALAGFAGPIGSVVGGLLGSVLGSALKRTRTGSATIGAGAGGSLAVASFSGNSARFREAAGQGGDSVIATIDRVAEALGASVLASAGAVSIGLRDGKYRVDPTGRGITKTRRGAVDFGEDAQAAIRFATLDLIKDGVLAGLKASTQRILQQAKDLDTGLQKALDFESVFSRLKAIDDPVGAALDGLDREFTRLQRIFADAGASTAEYADLERLYGIERAKLIREAGEATLGGLRDLLSELTVGNDALSLRTRLGQARAAYDPLAARVAAGDRTAYDDFAAAARQLLDLQREYAGSTGSYFDLLDQVSALTRTRIDAETNVAAISAGRDSPFDANGQPTNAVNDNAAVVGAIREAAADNRDALESGFASIIRELQAGRLWGQGTPIDPAFRTANAF